MTQANPLGLGLLALGLLAVPLLAGCLGEETVEQGPACPTFDTAGPAGTARLEPSGAKPRPAEDTYVLTITGEEGTVEKARFHDDGCVGFDLPEHGTYTLTVEADDPQEDECTWLDQVEQSFTEEDPYADVTLNPRRVCR